MVVFDMASEEFTSLLKENQELKKQVEDKTEDYRRMKDNFDSKVDVLTKIENQQKEFINYLLKEIENKRRKSTSLKAFERNVIPLKDVLQKYKEIIEDDK